MIVADRLVAAFWLVPSCLIMSTTRRFCIGGREAEAFGWAERANYSRRVALLTIARGLKKLECPHALDDLARTFAIEAPQVAYHIVVLGFVRGTYPAPARWLTHAEICDGILGALRSRAPLTIVGTVRPWDERP